ncbi:hypothetical protein BZA77DRAFT_295229 [Pyronema omphalodes]|nr:hypothetical protein BZA77DRAFT_295694 [Pyronema omphalodes]KAI5814370.1 hypothetical protein BZA77DRAFT_295229 [Pyronema omphalodes]
MDDSHSDVKDDQYKVEAAALKNSVAALPRNINEQQQVISGAPRAKPHGLLLCNERDDYATVKATQKEKLNESEATTAAATSSKTATTKNGGRGKTTHQPKPINDSAKKTWAEVIECGGIDVQMMLGNDNFGLTTPPPSRE